MIFIQDSTTEIVFNKCYHFEDDYVVAGDIDAKLTITSKMSKQSIILQDNIVNNSALRYFTFETTGALDLEEGNYSYSLQLKSGSAYESYEVGILQRELKLNPSESYSYITGSDTVFVYD